jgi:hypothetical protein
MDLFGKQARQELEQLQLKMRNLESRYNCMEEMHSRANEELRESTAMVAAINAAKQSEALFQSAKLRHDQKVDEYCTLFKEMTEKETELLAAHEKKKNSMSKEMRELKETDRAIKTSLSVSIKRVEALEKEIQAGEIKRDSLAAEIENLKTGSSNAEVDLSKTQKKHSELTGAVDKLTRLQDALSKSNLYLNQVVSHLNRHGDDDTVFAALEHDLHRFLADDRTSGAMQVALEARPLLLVVDFGYDALNFAAVRAGLVSGDSEISLQFESRKIEQAMGCSRFEALLAGWVWERFSAIHPRLKESVKKQNWVALSLPVARRLLALLCQGAPQGVVEETIVIDSEPFSASIPLQREELVSIFLPLLGPDGELMGAIRRFLAEFKLSVDAIDRVVCMGWYGRLSLVRESLGEVIKRPILVSTHLLTMATKEVGLPLASSENSFDKVPVSVNIVRSEPGRELREKDELEYHKLEERKLIEQEMLEKFQSPTIHLPKYDFTIDSEVVTDTRTGLMWARNANIAGKNMMRDEVKNWIKDLIYSGYNDWRCPKEDEFHDFVLHGKKFISGSVLDYNAAEWLYCRGFFNVKCGYYWLFLNDPRKSDPTMLYCLSDGSTYGYSHDRAPRDGYVWPVRDGLKETIKTIKSNKVGGSQVMCDVDFERG